MKTKPKKPTKKMTKPAAKKAAKPAAKKAFTHRQQFGKDLQEFEIRVNEKLDAFRQALNSVVERMWKNIQLLDNGLQTSEAHVIMIRRVFDDILNDVLATRDVQAQKLEVVDGVATTKDVPAQMVNWEHYSSWYMQEMARARAAKQAAIDKAKAGAESAQAAEPEGGNDQAPVVDKHDSEPHEKTAELVMALDQTEAKKEEPQAPPKDDGGIPDGAAVFGGEGV